MSRGSRARAPTDQASRPSPRKPKLPHPSAALFDTYSILFRAHYALPSLFTTSGEPTGALYGTCAFLLKVLREFRPRALAFALDAPKRTFRHERHSGYKAQRPPVPTELGLQLQRLPQLLAAFNVPTWCAPGFEADDVIATLTSRLQSQGSSVLIVSGDRDLLQLVADQVQVWFVGARGKDAKLFDTVLVNERFGVPPHRLPAFVALIGDASDNLQGAPGIGPRTASKLVSKYETVQSILEHVSELSNRKVKSSLEQHSERLLMNEELLRLRRDLPLEGETIVAPLGKKGIEQLRKLFTELEFSSLLGRLEKLTTSE